MDPTGSNLPVIELEKCDGCGKCVPACPAKALEVASGKVRVTHTNCAYCGECEAACPTEAISCPYDIVWQ
ncbi:MAG: 4Fe-4S binding protein [Chloroflexota bacterium]|jgi:ferredoxin